MRKGYLTVYLSLSLTLILTFILTMVEGARISTVRMEAECVADIGMNSVLAEFHRELLEQYDLLFVDMSYGTDKSGIENTAQHLRSYLQNNLTPSDKNLFPARDWLALSVDKAVIKEFSIASDNSGNVMKRQALEYMKESSVEGIVTALMEQVEEIEGYGLNTRNIEAERNSVQAQIDAIELPVKEDENGRLVQITLDNPADRVNAARSGPVLGLVLGDTSHLPGTVIYPDHYISHRRRITGTGISPGLREPEGLADNLLFDCYLFEKCGRYGNELEKSLLKYQIEYIIAGKASDMENLEKVAAKLLLWREVANVIYLFSDSYKCAEAEFLALTLTAVLLVPELMEPVKYSLLFAWAYVESLCDVKCLLNEGRVPIMKTSADWRTGIGNVVGFSGSIPDVDRGERGLSYEDYLRIILFMVDSEEKNLRAMDIMEMDIRRTSGNSYFRMDACFDSYLADITISSAFGYHCSIKKRYSYD